MTARSDGVTPTDEASRILDRGFWFVAGLGLVCIALIVAAMAGSLGSPDASNGSGAASSASPSGPPPRDPRPYLLAVPRPAPALELVDQDGRPFSLADRRGAPTFVFFGYSHCPDVCPATVGHLGLALAAHGPGVRAVFVSVDPARDTTTWLAEYVRFLPAGFTALTGTEAQVRTAADGWGVRYARVETAVPGDYSMSHTADVFLIDAAGLVRAVLPFGTDELDMTAVLRAVEASPATPPAATPGPIVASSAASASTGSSLGASPGVLGVEVVSSSIWSGPAGPIIVTLSVDGRRLDDPTVHPTIQLSSLAGAPVGDEVTATPVRPPGLEAVSYVAMVPIPAPGTWRITVTAHADGRPLRGSAVVNALDPGTTAAISGAAPTAHTPTLADVGGVARAVTTDPAPDLRLSARSTTDALADRRPFALVVDSSRFRVSPACGRAIVMARYLLDRWPGVDFIHLEPYRYSVIADTAVLDGSLDAPTLTDPAAAWGFGGAPWGARSMPWVFIVDGSGVVRAKFQGVMGTTEVDIMLALVAAGG